MLNRSMTPQAQYAAVQGDLSVERDAREADASAAAQRLREREKRLAALEEELKGEHRRLAERDQAAREMVEKVRGVKRRSNTMRSDRHFLLFSSLNYESH